MLTPKLDWKFGPDEPLRDERRVSPEDLRHSITNDSLRYWTALKGAARMPAVEAYRPDKFPHPEHVSIADVIDGGAEYYFQSMCSHFLEAQHTTVQGMTTEQVDVLYRGAGPQLWRIYDHVRTAGKPMAVRGFVHSLKGARLFNECVFLPFGPTDRSVEMIASVVVYGRPEDFIRDN